MVNEKECTFDGCNRKQYVRQLCRTHYRQYNAGQELKPIEEYLFLAEPAPGKKICTLCLTVKDKYEDFYHRPQPGLVTSRCKECMIRINGENQRLRAAKKKGVVSHA